MSHRGRPRKAGDESPGASVPQTPQATRKKSAPRKEEQGEDKKPTDAKARHSSNSTAEPQTPRPSKSGGKKAAPLCSGTRGRSTEENPSTELQPAPEKGKKSQMSESDKTTCAPKQLEVRPRRPARDANSTPAPQTAKSSDKKPASDCSARRGSSIDENPSKVLQTVLEKLKVKKSQRSESSKCVNDLQNIITEYVKVQLDWCRDIKVLKTGSYYENVKICQPDEFDVMLTIRVDRVILQPFSEDGAFYSVEMKRSPKSALEKFLTKDKTLKASEMLSEFREKVKEAVAELEYVRVERKKMGCPAVTLLVNEKGRSISIDFVLGLEVHSSWPDFTQNGFQIENWLSKKVKMAQRQKQFYLVPKYEGRGNVEQDGKIAKDAWRISFSHVEKDILKNHGNSKTCCEGGQKCCRKPCLKLLKYLLKRLKEEYPEEADKFCSYHAKTTLLHACATRVKDSEWAGSELSQCFQLLLSDFENHLRSCQLPNFFIPSQNLFNGISKKNCKFLADRIEYQRNNGFPLLF